MRLLISLLFISLACASRAGAQDLPGDPMAGRELARNLCAECHVVEPGQGDVPGVGAPPFPGLASDTAVTEMSLRFLLQRPHDRMPDLLLTKDQTDDVISHILTLKPQ